MASIIRSPAISNEKRTLSTRRSKAKPDNPPDDASCTPSDEASHVTSPSPKIETPTHTQASEVMSLVEQARIAVLNQFKEEAEAARELGRQRGLREGRLTGSEEAKETFSAEFARIRSLANKLQQSLKVGIGNTEEMAVAIAYEAVCKIIGDVAVTREGIRELVRQAVTQTRNTERIVVHLHAADLAILQDAGALDVPLAPDATVSWVADKRVELGGCVIETDGGELDARLETQIERLRKALLAARSPTAPHQNASPDRRKKSRTNYSPDRRKKVTGKTP